MEGFSLIYAYTDHKVGCSVCCRTCDCAIERERFDLQSSFCWEKIFSIEEVCGMYHTWKEGIYQILLLTA